MKSTSSSRHGVPFPGVGDGPAIGRSPHRVNSPTRAPMFSAAETGCGTAHCGGALPAQGERVHAMPFASDRTSQGRSRPQLHAVDLHSEGFERNEHDRVVEPARPTAFQGERCELGQQRPQNGSVVFAGQSPRAGRGSRHNHITDAKCPLDQRTTRRFRGLVGSSESRCWETVLRRDLGATAMREGEHGRHGRATRWVGRCPMALRASSPCRRSRCHPRRPSGRSRTSWTAADPLPRTKSLRLAGKPGRPRSGTCGRASRRSVSRSPMRPAATRPGRSDSADRGQEVAAYAATGRGTYGLDLDEVMDCTRSRIA